MSAVLVEKHVFNDDQSKHRVILIGEATLPPMLGVLNSPCDKADVGVGTMRSDPLANTTDFKLTQELKNSESRDVGRGDLRVGG